MTSLTEHCISCLTDTRCYLDALSEQAYQMPVDLLSGSTIGQHSRHFIEFFQCLLQQAPGEVINYDLRQRDKKIEKHPAVALAAIEVIIANLKHLDEQQTITLQAEMGGNIQLASNLGREMLYNFEHCIHHLAIIKIGLTIVKPELVLPDNFGVAASTTKYREGQLSVSN